MLGAGEFAGQVFGFHFFVGRSVLFYLVHEYRCEHKISRHGLASPHYT